MSSCRKDFWNGSSLFDTHHFWKRQLGGIWNVATTSNSFAVVLCLSNRIRKRAAKTRNGRQKKKKKMKRITIKCETYSGSISIPATHIEISAFSKLMLSSAQNPPFAIRHNSIQWNNFDLILSPIANVTISHRNQIVSQKHFNSPAAKTIRYVIFIMIPNEIRW